jgi:hypothetical protein
MPIYHLQISAYYQLTRKSIILFQNKNFIEILIFYSKFSRKKDKKKNNAVQH